MELRTGTSVWELRPGLRATYPALDRDVTADVAIIGAGITGALAAYELARAGASVIVLDRAGAVSGSSTASSGLLLYETDSSLDALIRRFGVDRALRIYRLGLGAIDRIEAMCGDLGDGCGFARRPNLYLASDEGDTAALEREFDLRARHGFDVECLNAREIAARYGLSAPVAIYSRGTAEIDPPRFTHSLLAAAGALGVRIYVMSPVTCLSAASDSAVLDVAGVCRVHARRVVCASGYEAAAHVHQRTGNLASTWACASDPVADFGDWPDRCLIWETARPYFYMRTTDDGRVLAGGGDEPGADTHRSPRRLEEKTGRLAARVREWFPRLPVRVACAWGATFATTDDGLPFVGRAPECPHVWFSLGYGGNGITFSVIAAGLLRDDYLGRPSPDAALFAFDRQREAA